MKKRAGKKGDRNLLDRVLVAVLLIVAIIGCVYVFTYEPELEFGEMPAPPTAISVDSCMVLDQAGEYYVLVNDIVNDSTCFSITEPGIILDGGGYSIIGSSVGNGIESSFENIAIYDIEISNFDNGILLAEGALNASMINVNSHDNIAEDISNFYEIIVQIKTTQDDYLSGEQVELTDASEI